MAIQVILKLGEGNWQQGFPGLSVQLWEDDHTISSQFVGNLPPAPDLEQLYQRWRSIYLALTDRLLHYRTAANQTAANRTIAIESTIEIEEEGITNISRIEFEQLCYQIGNQFNDWLETSSFRRVERQLRTRLSPHQAIRIVVETEDPLLQRFPWHLWNFFQDYPLAEVALSVSEYERVTSDHVLQNSASNSASNSVSESGSNSVRILAVLGNSQGIDVQPDRTVLEQLPQTETVFLVEPERPELDRQLWHEQGWDILFFAGHSTRYNTSQTNDSISEIALNQTENLTIEQLRNALKTAIARGIKLAIFNSCDGVGLARSLAMLHIPQVIVMREPVPDRVAQAFLQHFLSAFARGESLYRSVREAREKLQGLEQEFPCASWLPVICQNPAEVPIEWKRLMAGGATTKPLRHKAADAARTHALAPSLLPQWQGLKIAGMTSLFVAGLVMSVRFLGVLQAWELAAFDHLMRLRPPELIDPQILVVEVTQQDIEQYGYPLEDTTLAELIGTLERYQPSAIGLDMQRFQPRGQGRSELISQFQQHQNLFSICSFTAIEQSAPPPELSAAQRIAQMGFSDLIVEGTNWGGTMREDLLSEQSGELGEQVRRQLLSYDPTLATTPSLCTTPYSLSFQLAFRSLAEAGVQPIAVNPDQNWQFGSVVFKKLPTRFAGYQQLDGLSSQTLINYRTAPPGAQVTLEQVLQGQVDRQLIAHRVVLIGTTAAVAKDSFDTLYGKMPGVWVHAHMLSQMLSAVMSDRPLIWALPQWGEWQWGDWLWILGWAAVGGGLAWRLRSWLWLGLADALATVALHQICLVLLIQGGWMPLVPSLLALWTTSIVSRVVMNSEIRRQ